LVFFLLAKKKPDPRPKAFIFFCFGLFFYQHNPFGFLAKLLAPIGARPKAKQAGKKNKHQLVRDQKQKK
jgi:hypothetical protein